MDCFNEWNRLHFKPRYCLLMFCVCLLCTLPQWSSCLAAVMCVRDCIFSSFSPPPQMRFVTDLFSLSQPSFMRVSHLIRCVLLSGAGIIGDRHPPGEEADPSLQLLRGWRADGVLRAGQWLGGAAVSDSTPWGTEPTVPPCWVLPGGKEPAHLWVRYICMHTNVHTFNLMAG